MKRAFTLVELLIVVMVMAILMTIVFRLSAIGEDAGAHAKTVTRLQRLENCLSGYYAAFGNYPPVTLHGSRNIYLKVNGYGIQQQGEEEQGKVEWGRVEAACRSQPIAMNYPFDSGMADYVNEVSRTLKEMHDADPESAYGKNPALAYLFDALQDPSRLSDKKRNREWTDIQLFRFGLLSFLLPRYLVMMRYQADDSDSGNSSGSTDRQVYDAYVQWSDNNQMPCRFEDGTPYGTWAELAGDLNGSKKWMVSLMPSQAVTARWLPNLEKTLTCEGSIPLLYGVDVRGEDEGNISIDNPNPVLFSPDSQTGEGTSGSQQYALDGVTCRDGWGSEFYYYSKPPYQGYRIWSAGKNGKTFPPWISEEELKNFNDTDRKKVLNWLSDDVVHMKN